MIRQARITLLLALLPQVALAGELPATAAGRLRAKLLAEPSATATLERWCADERLANPPTIQATLTRDTRPPPPDLTKWLTPATLVLHRHVQLFCGTHLLSEAECWYRPDRLPPALAAALLVTDRPFGAVVRPIGFDRQILAQRDLGPGLDPDSARLPEWLWRNRAVLRTGGQVFAGVIETYSRGVVPGQSNPEDAPPANGD